MERINATAGFVEASRELDPIADGPFMASVFLAVLAMAGAGETQRFRPMLMCYLIDFGSMISEAATGMGNSRTNETGIARRSSRANSLPPSFWDEKTC